MTRKTKIVATIGPACVEIKSTIAAMIAAGMNIARLNFSHGDYTEHESLIAELRRASSATENQVLIMQDLQGPKIRVGVLPEMGVAIKAGQEVVLNTALTEYAGVDLPLTYPGLEKNLRAGDRILIDDGHIQLQIKEIVNSRIVGVVAHDGVVHSHKGLNFPDSELTEVLAISEKDKQDLVFGLAHQVDMVAMSFVRTANDIRQLRALMTEEQQKTVKIIAKIELQKGVDHINEIVTVADAVMVARGDLALETAMAEVPVVQKRIIRAAHRAKKPVVLGTQMLASMEENALPTRAEVSDVANAVLDGADGVMLSNETATGKFPVEAITMMAAVIAATERSEFFSERGRRPLV